MEQPEKATEFRITNGYGQMSEPHAKGDTHCTTGHCNDPKTEEGRFSGIFPLRCECGGVIHADRIGPSAAANEDFGSIIDIECDQCGGEIPVDEDIPKLRAARLMF